MSPARTKSISLSLSTLSATPRLPITQQAGAFCRWNWYRHVQGRHNYLVGFRIHGYPEAAAKIFCRRHCWTVTRSETLPNKTLSDQNEFWAYTSPGAASLINTGLTGYQQLANSSDCTGAVFTCRNLSSNCTQTGNTCIFMSPWRRNLVLMLNPAPRLAVVARSM